MRRWWLALLFVVSMLPVTGLRAADAVNQKPTVQILKTDGGVRFGILGSKPEQPAPTLIVLASSPEDTLGNDYFLQCGVALSKQGYLCVSLDLPCHGQERVTGEPDGIAGWRHRLDAGQDLLGDFQRRSQAMLDYLIANNFTDPERIAACGTSRGGFAALHLAAHDRRIQCVAAMAPVTDLLVLDEFKAMKQSDRAAMLSIEKQAPALVDRGVWIVIGDRDVRVGTDQAIAFARRLSAVAVERKIPSRVELIVRSEARGHTTPPGSAEMAATWVAEELERARSK